MKVEKNAKRYFSLFAIASVILFLGFSIEAFAGPADTGAFTKCTYTSGLSSSGYSSAIVYYPCQTGSGPFAATTLTGGWTNTKEDMSWLGNHLVTHGFIVIAMTPNNIYGYNSEWRTAHKAGIDKLISENSRSTSPINGLVDTTNLQIMGFSKGGGGALLASSDVGSKIKSTQALAPYMDFSYNISGIRSATICYTGTNDIIASPSKVVGMYNSLPGSIDRTLAYFSGVSHLDWNNGGSYQDRLRTYVTSWMKVYLDGDTGYTDYIDGSQNWFYDFKQSITIGDASDDTSGDTSTSTVVNGTVNGTYSIVALHSGKALDTWEWGTQDGTNIAQYNYWGGEAQQFVITPVDGIWHRITPVIAPDQAVDVSGCSTADGANIQTWSYWGGACQQFRFQAAGTGVWRIISRNSEKCLDVLNASTADGANVLQYTCTSGAQHQMFELIRR